MGIQFRLGPGDHKPVEDFLSRDHAGTTAITLDTNATRHQHDAAAAAVAAHPASGSTSSLCETGSPTTRMP